MGNSGESRHIENFMFSLKAGQNSREDLEMRVEALTGRLDKLDEKATITNDHGHTMNVVWMIVQMASSPEEVSRLGKALVRAGEILPEHKALSEKLSAVKILSDDPEWFAATFGDFENEVDKFTDNFFK